jgi:antirestriction protein ArdC
MYYNELTKKPYSGKNIEILEATGLKGGFLTFNQAMKLGYKIPKGTKTIAKLIRPMLEEVEVNKGKWEVKQSGRLFPVFHKSQLEEKGA